MTLPLPVNLAIEHGIQSLLKLDPESRDRLALLDGKVIAVNVLSPAMTLVFSVVDGRVHVIGDHDDEADTTITGSLQALRSLSKGNDALYRNEVSIDGDMETAQALKRFLAQVDPDWEEFLSPLLGDTVVHQLSLASRSLGQWFDRTRDAMARNTSNYLQEETEMLAPNALVRDMCNEIDTVRAEADRLEARVLRLERQRNGGGEGAC